METLIQKKLGQIHKSNAGLFKPICDQLIVFSDCLVEWIIVTGGKVNDSF